MNNQNLISAARLGRFDVVKLLIDRGANVDAGGIFDYTPLIWAAQYGNWCIFLTK